METRSRSFVPAAGRDWLLPFYDPLFNFVAGDSERRSLVECAEILPGQRILDIGCGTGSLLCVIKHLHPDAEVVGLDPDPKALARARRKAERAGVSVQLDQGFSDELPYPDACFERVFSTHMLHHLKPEEQSRTLAEVHRVLAPRGDLHVVDFGGSGPRKDGLLARFLHGHVHANFDGGIPALMREAGFEAPEQVSERGTLFGRLAHYQATRSG